MQLCVTQEFSHPLMSHWWIPAVWCCPSLACMYSLCWCAVASRTLSLMLKWGSLSLSLFTKCAWVILDASKVSLACDVNSSMLLMNFVAITCASWSAVSAASPSLLPTTVMGSGMLTSTGTSQGEHPIFMKGDSPIEVLRLFMMWKHTLGSAQAHPFWLCSTWNCSAWTMVLFDHSADPSVVGDTMLSTFCGWCLWVSSMLSWI